MMCRTFSVLFAVVCLVAIPAAAQKVEKGAPAPDSVPAALKAAIESQGLRVLNEAGAAYVEIWLRKGLPAEAKEASGDIAYPGMPVGSFLGVWRYVIPGTDFRGQAMKPGVYSMRHALMPSDGNHMGASPFRDFVLLAPVDADKDPAADLKYDDAVALSRKATGTNHPAVYPMLAPESVSEAVVSKDEQGHGVLKVKVQGKSGTAIPLAFIVIGRGE